jgi:hypothetical protein
MPQFSVRDMLLSTTLIGGGLFLLVRLFSEPAVGVGAKLVCWFGGGSLIGAGVFAPLGRPWAGVTIGLEVQLLIVLLVVIIRLVS